MTPWIVFRQAPLSTGFFRQEHWNGLPFPCPGDLSKPEINPASPPFPALAGGFSTTEPPGKHTCRYTFAQIRRLYNTKSESQGKLWTLGDNDVLLNLLKSNISSINNLFFCENFNTVANEKEKEEMSKLEF